MKVIIWEHRDQPIRLSIQTIPLLGLDPHRIRFLNSSFGEIKNLDISFSVAIFWAWFREFYEKGFLKSKQREIQKSGPVRI